MTGEIMNKLFSKKAAAFISAVIISAVLSGCGINAPGTKEYVDSVKQDMLVSVNETRKLKEQQKTADVRTVDDADANMQTLDNLDNVYTDLILLESPDAYNELDDEIKKNSSSALSYIKELKSLVTAAKNTANDSLYKQDLHHIMEQYEENYNALKDLGSQIITKYRND